MIKKLFTPIITACILAMGISAGAATITSMEISDIDNSIVTIKGTVAATDNEVSVTVVPDGGDPAAILSGGTNLGASAIIIQPAQIDTQTKTFSSVFKFNAPVAAGGTVYDVYVSNNNTPYEFRFVNKTECESFVDDVASGTITGDAIYTGLETYGQSIGVDVSFATTTAKQEYISQKIGENAAQIAAAAAGTPRVEKINEIVTQIKADIEFIDNLALTTDENAVHQLITGYETQTGVDTTYSSLTNDMQRKAVCQAFIGNTSYANMDLFVAALKTKVTQAKIAYPTGTPAAPVNPSTPQGNTPSSQPSAPTPSQPSGVNTSGNTLLQKYNDVGSAVWAMEAIDYVVSKGIMEGTAPKTFAPNEEVTREQVAKIITVAFGKYNKDAKSPFGDVSGNHWANSYIGSAYESGLMNGVSSGAFGMGQKMTREDLCTVFYRAAQKMGHTFATKNTNFADFESTSTYAQDAVGYLAGAGVISGMGDSMMQPKGTATRAQTAQMLMKVAQILDAN